MKSMTKLMVIAMVLVAALVVAPAAARTSQDGIVSGDTIYVGEENLNFGAIGAVGRLVHFSDPTAKAVDNIIEVSNPADFDVSSSAVGTITGQYNAFAAGADPQTATSLGFVIINIPDVKLDVVLNNSVTNSVNGKSVTRDNTLAFKVTNNLAGFGIYPVLMNIEVVTPGGGTLTTFGGQDLRNVPANGTTQYKYGVSLAGVETGTYTAQAKFPSGTDFYNKGYNSNTVSFEVLSKKLAIESNKDTVVRGNTFVVTITGESVTAYNLFVKDASLLENQYPLIAPGQPGVTIGGSNATGAPVFAATNASVSTTAGGTRAVQFNTTQTTDDRTFTLRVQSRTDPATYDEVKVKIEKGAVTATASGTGIYYIGEEVTLSGTNTDSDTTYLFITGPNLGANGVKLDNVTQQAVDGQENTFVTASVEADDTWSYKWSTGDLGQVIDAGSYTVYAVSTPVNKGSLSNAQYATVSVVLKSPFITATVSSSSVAKGDKLTITGTAQGNPSNVYVWIFGKNLRIYSQSASVDSDGSFEYKLDNTADYASGQYFVVVQHPMAGGQDVTFEPPSSINAQGMTAVNLAALQASDAATALVNALNSPNVDDTYTKLTFLVEEPFIRVDTIGDQTVGSTFTITGTTNLAAGDELLIDVTSASFQPTEKTQAAEFSGASGTVTVQKGEAGNTWSFEVDTTGFKPDEYIVNIESVETGATQTTTFNLVEGAVTTVVPTGTATVTGTVTATETATATATPTPTPTPGFGAVIALIGLGAVAFLVLRRN
jgi:PGF-CTERM protein